MNVRTAALALIAVAAACGGKVTGEPDSTGSTGSTISSTSGSSAPNVSPTPTTTSPSSPPSDEFCGYNGSTASSSSGPDGSYGCMSDGSYVCGHGASYPEINCQCNSVDGGLPTGSCSCDGTTFDLDCAQGCSPSAAVYAKCGVRLRP